MPARRTWTALLAALLLLVPFALRAHVHTSHPGSDCAVCVVSHHAPAVRVSAPAVGAPALVAATVAPAVGVVAATEYRPAHTGRGPPSATPTTSS